MNTVELAVKHRTEMGTKGAKAIRRREAVPGIIYGHGIEPLAFEVNERALYKMLHGDAGSNALLNLQLEGATLKETTCRIKAIQHNPVTDKIAHLDLLLVSLDEKVSANVHIVTKNAEECVGAKAGGVIDLVHHEVEVECAANKVPDHIEVDIKELQIGDSVHVKDVQLPDGVEWKLDPEEVLIAIHAPRTAEEETPAEEEGEAPAGPEVIEKGKKDEEEPKDD